MKEAAPIMPTNYTRRKFIAANSVALLASRVSVTAGAHIPASNDSAKLAKDGGPKTVRTANGKWARWDEREKQQLGTAVDQPSLFYWAGK